MVYFEGRIVVFLSPMSRERSNNMTGPDVIKCGMYDYTLYTAVVVIKVRLKTISLSLSNQAVHPLCYFH